MKSLFSALSTAFRSFRQTKSLTICLSTLIGIVLLIALLNFTPGTWFSGWDNVHPEFNFSLNISRAVSLVWQGNQGTGTYGGHGYETTLLHALILFVFSFFMPDMYLRFFFTFLCLMLGAVGVFFLIRRLLSQKQELLTNCSALVGGLFYALNFGTVQNFYIQLEAFIIHFAALPWIFLSLIWFLEKKTKRSLGIFTAISFLTTMQGFIPPLFFVFILLLGLFLASYVLLGDGKLWTRVKLSTLVVVITMLLNAYWFGPVVLYTFTRTTTYLEAYNNLSSTGDFILKNKKYGDLPHLSILQGFISEAIDTDKNNTVFEIFTEWKKHLASSFVLGIGYSFFAIIVAGLVVTTTQLIQTFKKRIPTLLASYEPHTMHTHFPNSSYIYLGLTLSFFLAFSLLATNTFPFNYVSEVMQQVPVAKQAFRVAFTKFSISVSFYYAIFLGIGLYAILSLFSRLVVAHLRSYTTSVITALTILSLVYFSLPTFAGHFLYNRTQIHIPQTYFQLFDFFKHQGKQERIANFPQGWNWGWSIYTWGYTGSGFLWYGIEQPLMDRSFDVWGKGNEQYYWELTHAVYAERYDLIDSIMQKYHVKWLIVDDNVIPYLNEKRTYFSKNLSEYLDRSSNYKKATVLHDPTGKSNDITIYNVVGTKSLPASSQVKPMLNIGPTYAFTLIDQAYLKYGDYYTEPETAYDVYFPYRTFFSNQKIESSDIGKLPISLKDNTTEIALITTLPEIIRSYRFSLPPKDLSYIEADPVLSLKGTELTAAITKIPGSIYDSRRDPEFSDHTAINCKATPAKDKELFTQTITPEKNLRFSSQNSENCYSIILSGLPQQYSYLVRVVSRHIKGKRLQLALINEESRRVDVEYALTSNAEFETNYLFIPPKKETGSGYTLHFNNISFGKDQTINEVQLVTVDPIPYNFMTNVELVKPTKTPAQPILAYYQSFDPAWRAYKITKNSTRARLFPYLFGKQLPEHVLVNNWANGWKLDAPLQSNEMVLFYFWPQHIEHLGLFIASIILIVTATMSRHKHTQSLKT